jgi:predicted enzyme related to lactoylglutathione lyase
MLYHVWIKWQWATWAGMSCSPMTQQKPSITTPSITAGRRTTHTTWDQTFRTDKPLYTGGMMNLKGPGIPEGIPPHWKFYFTVDDIEAAQKRVIDAGGKILLPPMDSLTASAANASGPAPAKILGHNLLVAPGQSR